MKIDILRIPTDFHGERCYVHARGLFTTDGHGVITMQKLELSGIDVFYGIEMIETKDGITFSAPRLCEGLKRRYHPDKSSEVMSDATPFFHKKTGKIILVGHTANYGEDNALLTVPTKKSTAYAVYDDTVGDFSAYKTVEMPRISNDMYFVCGSGCAQICETESGELLIPFYFRSYDKAFFSESIRYSAAVMRCSFDGEKIEVLDIGNAVTVDAGRGLYEPSIIKFGEEYYVALRNDFSGYVTKSCDGVHIETPTELCFDDGENVGNYNTQQHWITGGGRLWIVYTRRAENNSHIFRHRAPLFIAEFDPITMRVLRDTEKIVVPERGARLGNFGCQSYSDSVGYVFASEWMQGDQGVQGCQEHGSDNSIFISKVTFD